jgi:hypothetical protein
MFRRREMKGISAGMRWLGFLQFKKETKKNKIYDIHGNEYDPKKMYDQQYDFSEEPEKESKILNYDL